jgi:Ca2+-binding RTX toxin-like protein
VLTFGNGDITMDNSLSVGHNTDSTITAGNGDDILNTAPGLSLTEESSVTAGNGDDVVTASAFKAGPSAGESFATITLGNGNDTVTVLGGDSTITLGDGNNTINSGGHSNITVGNGANTINVGMSDTISVGHGNDTFVFNQTAPNTVGNVTISGFDPGHDVIQISAQEATALGLNGTPQQMDGELAALFQDTGPAGSAQLHLDATDSITLTDVHTAALTAHDFLIA